MGSKTLNDIFYKPDIGASGAVEKGKFDDGLDVADGLIEGNKVAKHTQGTDQGLDTGGGNAVVVADIKDAVTKKHTQNTDTDLDATFEATFVKKTDKLSVLAASTSADLAGVLSDEVGTGKAVFNDSPTFITKITTPIIDLTGGQVKFPAIVNPSANVNTLDDYEEGEWTLALKFGGNSVDMTYTLKEGFYTKVGRQVTATALFILSSKGSSTGSANIGGLPFVSKNSYGAYSAVILEIEKVTFVGTFTARINMNTSEVKLIEVTEAGETDWLNNTDFADNSLVVLTATYFTD